MVAVPREIMQATGRRTDYIKTAVASLKLSGAARLRVYYMHGVPAGVGMV